jgi:hypothetical protein
VFPLKHKLARKHPANQPSRAHQETFLRILQNMLPATKKKGLKIWKLNKKRLAIFKNIFLDFTFFYPKTENPHDQ